MNACCWDGLLKGTISAKSAPAGCRKIHAIDALLLAHFQGNAALLRMLDVQRLEHLSLEMARGTVESLRKPAQLPAWQQANREAVIATADPSM
jgi:hypothetical protein